MSRLALAMVATIASLLLLGQPDARAQSSLYLLRVQGDGSGYGQVSSSPAGLSCSVSAGISCFQYFNAGSSVVLTAAPSADSDFAGWSGACTGMGPCTVTMSAGKTVTATFNARSGTHFLSVGTLPATGTARGSITSSPAGINCGATCKAAFPSGTTVTLTASPAAGYVFSGWSGDCAGTGSCIVSMTAPKSAFATFAAAPAAAANYTALWWNPTESGWGLNIAHQGNVIFATLFTYDASKEPLWLFMSGGTLQSSGVFSGDLYRSTGPAFNAAPYTPITSANLTRVGTMTLNFFGPDSATLTYNVGDVQVTKFIQRMVFGSRLPVCTAASSQASRATSRNYQDLWWNPAESGWGLNVTHQDETIFATMFTYDASGRDLWLVMSGGRVQPDGSYLGDLYRTRGPAFNANPFTPIGAADMTVVGSMRLRFQDGNNGTLVYSYGGVEVTKTISRMIFSSPVPVCN